MTGINLVLISTFYMVCNLLGMYVRGIISLSSEYHLHLESDLLGNCMLENWYINKWSKTIFKIEKTNVPLYFYYLIPFPVGVPALELVHN